MKNKKKQVILKPEDTPININVGVHTIHQLRCVIDGSEVKLKEIKKAIENKEIDELWIFGISNKLYIEILTYLKDNQVKHVVYGRSRITISY